MRAISLWQPWATLLVRGVKKIETRGWDTKYRGDLIIHAAKKTGHEELEDWKSGADYYGLSFSHGAYVGIVNLHDTKPSEWFKNLTLQELTLGNYANGRFGWLCQNFREFTEPLPAKGQQGFWTPKPEVYIELLNRNAVRR